MLSVRSKCFRERHRVCKEKNKQQDEAVFSRGVELVAECAQKQGTLINGEGNHKIAILGFAGGASERVKLKTQPGPGGLHTLLFSFEPHSAMDDDACLSSGSGSSNRERFRPVAARDGLSLAPFAAEWSRDNRSTSTLSQCASAVDGTFLNTATRGGAADSS